MSNADPFTLDPGTRSVWQEHVLKRRSALAGDRDVDVAIVGGGMAGLSLAYWLRELAGPDLSIAVLEGRQIGLATSGRNAGLILAGVADYPSTLVRAVGDEEARRLWTFTEANREGWKEFVARRRPDDRDTILRGTGSYRLATYPNEVAEVHDSARILADWGVPVTLLSEADIRTNIGGQQFLAGLYLPGDCQTQPVRLLEALLDVVSATGTRVFEESPVSGLREGNDGRTTLTTPRGTVTADRVVLAVNAYLPLLLPEYRHLISPRRGQILLLQPLQGYVLPDCGYGEYGFIYWQQLPDGRIVAGGLRHHAMDVEIGYDEVTTDFLEDRIRQWFIGHFPELDNAKVVGKWGGTMGFSADGLPMLGALPGREGVHLLAGFTGHGLGMAFECARGLAQLLVEGGQPRFPRLFSTRSKHRLRLFFDDELDV